LQASENIHTALQYRFHLSINPASNTEYADQGGWGFMDAMQNARLKSSAERHYRVMYYGGI
jgi:hypothetical protein